MGARSTKTTSSRPPVATDVRDVAPRHEAVAWSRIEAAAGFATGGSAWLHRSENLLVSACMMTVMSGVGLARFLPRGTDWVPRARQATPAFGGLSLLMIVLVLIQRAVLWAATGG